MTALVICILKLRKRHTYFHAGYFYVHSKHSKQEWLKEQMMVVANCHWKCAQKFKTLYRLQLLNKQIYSFISIMPSMHSLGWHLQQGRGRINSILHQNKLCQINNVQGNLFKSLAINYITQHHFTFFCGTVKGNFPLWSVTAPVMQTWCWWEKGFPLRLQSHTTSV